MAGETSAGQHRRWVKSQPPDTGRVTGSFPPTGVWACRAGLSRCWLLDCRVRHIAWRFREAGVPSTMTRESSIFP
jgi:hypothetical protein